MALKLAFPVCMQINSMDVYAVEGAGESDCWEQISRKALSLDRDDFLPTGYKVRAKFKAPANTPPRPEVAMCEHYRQYRQLVVLFFLVFSKFLLDISSSRVKRWQTRFILSWISSKCSFGHNQW